MPPTLDDLDLVTSWLSDDAAALLSEMRAALVQRGGTDLGDSALAELDEAEANGGGAEQRHFPCSSILKHGIPPGGNWTTGRVTAASSGNP